MILPIREARERDPTWRPGGVVRLVWLGWGLPSPCCLCLALQACLFILAIPLGPLTLRVQENK